MSNDFFVVKRRGFLTFFEFLINGHIKFSHFLKIKDIGNKISKRCYSSKFKLKQVFMDPYLAIPIELKLSLFIIK